jgi:hypothetical protein
MGTIAAIKILYILYSGTNGRIPVRRTVTVHILGAGISRFNICFSLIYVLPRPHLHFYWPFLSGLTIASYQLRNCSTYVTGATYIIFFLFTGETAKFAQLKRESISLIAEFNWIS